MLMTLKNIFMILTSHQLDQAEQVNIFTFMLLMLRFIIVYSIVVFYRILHVSSNSHFQIFA